jgi:hypothetical protein
LEAEQKLQRIRNGIILLEREANLFKSHMRRLSQVIEVEVPNAKAKIDSMTDALENYIALAPMAGSSPAEGRTEGSEAQFAVNDSVKRSAIIGDAASTISTLRARSLAVEERQGIPQGKALPTWLISLPAMLDVTMTEKLQVTRTPPNEQDTVIIAETDSIPGAFYLERLPKISPGDSGWYVAPADGTPVVGHIALTVGALQAARPDWAAWLSLPPGYLILCLEPQRQTIVNPENQTI